MPQSRTATTTAPTKNPLVSVIVPTRNSAATLEACLHSVQSQTYPRVELIVVDRDSTDRTPKIAKTFTRHVYRHGPERSAQRNLGAARASGHYLLFIDADMELTPKVIAHCVTLAARRPKLSAVNIPETSFGQGFWAHCKALERTYYQNLDWMESPRFMPAATFKQAGAYDTAIAGGEDWDLTQRLRALGPFGRVAAPINHNEGRLTLRYVLRKRFYYAQGFSQYYAKGSSNKYTDALRLYGLFFSRPLTTLRHPIQWLGMLFMKSAELTASAIGYAIARRN